MTAGKLRRWTLGAALALCAANAANATAAVRPDLTVRSVVPGAQLSAAGKKLAVTVTARSARTATPRTTVAFFLSSDRRFDRRDRRLSGAARLRRMRAGRNVKARASLRIPTATPLGSYHLLACVDPARRVRERAEGNNCRAARTRVAVTGRPRPFAAAAAPDAGRAAAADIGRGGGSVSATAADGTRFTLAFPDGALLDPAKVTLTPVALSGLPRGATGARAVQIEPAGRRLVKPAQLTVTPPGAPAAATLTGLGFAPGGGELHLVPPRAEGAGAVVPVFELGGAGIAAMSAANRFAFSRERLPTSLWDQLLQVAAAPKRPAGARARSAGAVPLPTDELSTMVFAGYLELLALPLTDLDLAVNRYTIWNVTATALQGAYPQIVVWRLGIGNAFFNGLQKEVADTSVRCVANRDTTQVGRLLRYRGYIRALADLNLAAADAQIAQAIDRCLRFEVDYDVAISGENSYGEGVKATVRSMVPVRMLVPGDPASFSGDAPLQVVDYWTGDMDCWTHTWNVTPLTPFQISRMAVEVMRERGLEAVPPGIDVTFRLGALDEQVTHTCSGDPDSTYTDQQHAYDGVTAALLEGAGSAEGGFTLRFTGGQGGSYAEQSFTRSTSQGGSYTGTIRFRLRHTPG